MNTHFSEHRMLAQRAPESGRRVELPGANELQDVLSGLQKTANDFLRSALTPENRTKINAIVEGFSKEFSQITNQVMSEIRRDLPKLGEYFRLGGRSGTEAGRYTFENHMGRLQRLLGNGERREYTLPADESASVSYEDDDGTVDVLDLEGSDEESFTPPSTTFVIDAAGMQRLLSENLAQDQRLSAERTRVLTDSASKLEALRASIGRTAPATTTVTPAAAPAADTGRTNLQPLPGESREQQRTRLEAALATARTAFDAQKAVVDRLVAAGSATPAETLRAERQKLVKLEQDVIGFEGQITALRGERVSDTPQPI